MNSIETLLTFENPDEKSIPNISLYMDQLQEYFESTLGDLKRQDEDTVLSKTMINNYVKSNLIKAPERKKYDHETISDLIIIYHLKKAFSIQDTKQILTLMKSDSKYYKNFVKDQNSVRSELASNISNEALGLTQGEALKMLNQLTLEVTIKKQMAEQLLDHLISKIPVQK